jgi:two-component system LytT family response regulator
MVKANRRIYLLRPEDVDYCEADGNDILLRVGPATHRIRKTMDALEAELNPQQFCRIHRSMIVNINRVRVVQRTGGEQEVVLHDGTRLRLSRGFQDRAFAKFGARL